MRAALLVWTLAVLAALGGVAHASPPKVARVQVSADEFTLALSRSRIPAGAAVVELVNYGEDRHDLVLRRLAPGARPLRIGSTRPGGVRSIEARLRPGRYALWCSLADHRARGMRAQLVIRAR